MTRLFASVRRAAVLALLVAAPALAAPLRVAEPLPGAEVRAGELMELRVEPTGDSVGNFREWEAFLSLDGGRSWPIRLTHHVPASERRVAVRVPAIPAGRALVLVKYGDEVDERELPPILISVESAGGVRPAAARPALLRGEAARPGSPGALFWTELAGGGSPVVREARLPTRALEAARRPDGGLGGSRFVRGSADPRALAIPTGSGARAGLARPPSPPAPRVRAARDVRRLIHRLNE